MKPFLKVIYFVVSIDKLIWPNFKMYLSKLHNQLLVSLFLCFISSHWHESFPFVSFILLAWVLVDFSQVGNMFEFISIVNLQVSISQVFFEHFNKRNGGATVAEELYQVLYIGKKNSWNISRSVLGKVATYRFHLVKSDLIKGNVCLFVQIFVHQASHRNPPGGGMRTAAPSATEKVFLPGQHFCLFVGWIFLSVAFWWVW